MEPTPEISIVRHRPSEAMRPVELKDDELQPFDARARAGLGWGQCTNATDEVLLVYGPKVFPAWDNWLYCLPPGWTTPSGWDCDGFYVPTDRVANQAFSRVPGPLAIKYFDTQHFVITRSGSDYNCFFNAGAYSPGTINWPIPTVPYITVAAWCTGV